MVSQAHLDKMAARQNYRNLWHTDLMSTMRADPGLLPVYLTCFANELFMVTCQGTHAVVAICLAVADVEKVNAQNFVWAPRFSFALAILLLLLASCCKMSSTYRPPSVTTALLDSCSASNNWPVYFPLSLALPEWKNFKKLLRYCLVLQIWFIARFVLVCRHSTRLNWTKEMANSDHSLQWQFLLINKCHEWISQFRHQLDTHHHQHMGNPTATHHHNTKVTHLLVILHRATPLLVTPGDIFVTLVGVEKKKIIMDHLHEVVLTKESILELQETISFGMLRMSFPLSMIVTVVLLVKQDCCTTRVPVFIVKNL